MAKRKTPEDVTEEQLAQHKAMDAISNHATRSEKTAWNRQYDNLTKLVRRLEPIEDKLMALQTEKVKIFDELLVLRKELVDGCVHPFEQLVTHDDYVICKFCERKMVLPKNGKETDSETEGTSTDS